MLNNVEKRYIYIYVLYIYIYTHTHIYRHIFRLEYMVLEVKNLPANARDIRDAGSIPGLGRSPGGGAWQPTPVFLPREFFLCPWGLKESDMTDAT